MGLLRYRQKIRVQAARFELRRRAELRSRHLPVLVQAFETTTDPAFCLRRLEVVAEVAKALGERVNNDLFRDVVRVAQALGWEPVKNQNRSLFRGVKRRGQDDAEALAVSRANRHDPRSTAGRRGHNGPAGAGGSTVPQFPVGVTANSVGEARLAR
jgi:hypothetical protein